MTDKEQVLTAYVVEVPACFLYIHHKRSNRSCPSLNMIRSRGLRRTSSGDMEEGTESDIAFTSKYTERLPPYPV